MLSIFIKRLFVLGTVLFGMHLGFSLPNHLPTESCEEPVEGAYYASKVRIYNRTDWNVQVYVDGYHAGEVWGEHNAFFSITPGAHRVMVQWPSGYYEYFDFSVCRGCVHKVWTSNYDG